MVILDRFFSFGEEKVVTGCIRQVVVLYSNNCMGIGLGRLRVVALERWSFEQV